MKVEILTLFPELFKGFLTTSLIKRAQDKGLLELKFTNIREFADPPHYKVDDTPYGGGAGMVMKPEPLSRAIKAAKKRLPEAITVLLTPGGKVFNQACASELSRLSQVIYVCGRYEGVDQRVIDQHIDLELSIGDYILMGGEVPAMVIIEASTRLIDNVLGNSDSLTSESFSSKNLDGAVLEAPQYTRPPEFESMTVPEVLLSGDHKAIDNWREKASKDLTAKNRPDLLSGLSKERK